MASAAFVVVRVYDALNTLESAESGFGGIMEEERSESSFLVCLDKAFSENLFSFGYDQRTFRA